MIRKLNRIVPKNKISLILTTYNRISFLKLFIISLKNQTIMPDEIIISDDGSQEDIEKLLREEFKNEKEIKVIFVKQKDEGFRASRARNNGGRVSTGELLIIVDSDIIMQPKFIENFYKKRKKGTINLSRSIRLSEEVTKLIDEEKIKKNIIKNFCTKKEIYRYYERFFKHKIYEIFAKKKYSKKFRSMAFSMYKDDYIEMDGMNESFIGWGSEDVEFGKRAFKLGLKINSSHLTDFQYHLYHGKEKVYLQETSEEINLETKKLEYGYQNTFGSDKYEVIKIN